MDADSHERTTQLTVSVEPELRKQIERVAAERDQSVAEFVVAALQRAVSVKNGDVLAKGSSWAQLSARAFARDWDSDEDRVYDDLP